MERRRVKANKRRGVRTKMKNAIVVDSNDIKKILSEKFNVSESNIIKSQYSYSIILDENSNKKSNKQIGSNANDTLV